jgi:hypothetical protein
MGMSNIDAALAPFVSVFFCENVFNIGVFAIIGLWERLCLSDALLKAHRTDCFHSCTEGKINTLNFQVVL